MAKKKNTICIDFDGVLHDYSNGFQGEDVFGAMVGNANNGTKALKRNGWRIIIFTTRKKTEKLEQWLKDNDISYDYINENPDQPEGTSGKVIADVYLDDRGVRFNGRWDKWLIDEILNFHSWQDGDKEDLGKINKNNVFELAKHAR